MDAEKGKALAGAGDVPGRFLAKCQSRLKNAALFRSKGVPPSVGLVCEEFSSAQLALSSEKDSLVTIRVAR